MKMRRLRRERLRELPFNRMIPNILTLLALCAGLTALHFGLSQEWRFAVLAIVVAGIFDGLDGRVARILKGASKFGAELDSLSDFICFGVAPVVLLYLWSLQQTGRFGWVLVLLFSVCCALRLARFNTALENPDRPAWTANYFTGVPSPMGAGLVLLPMMLSFQFEANIFRQPIFIAVFVVVVAAGLVSTVPTYSFKKLTVPRQWVLPTMLLVGTFAALIISAPWLTMAATLIAYILVIPLGIRSHAKLQKAGRQSQAATAAASTGGSGSPNP